MNMGKIKKYYDPVYRAVISQRTGERLGFGISARDRWWMIKNRLAEFFDTYEMRRMVYNKAEELIYHSFPSATYSLFSHILGTLYLASVASQRIYVGNVGQTLVEWLDKNKLLEEFLSILLLKKIYTFPFSKVTSLNKHFRLINPRGILLGVLTDGENKYKVSLEKIKQSGMPGVKYTDLTDLLNGFNGLNKSSVKDVLKATIDEKFRLSPNLRVLFELLDGLINIFRIDRTIRTAFYTGEEIGLIEPETFFRDIVYNIENNTIEIKRHSVDEIVKLLRTFEHTYKNVSNLEECLCFEAMMDYCISKFFDGNPEKKHDFLFWTEYDFMKRLFETNDTDIKIIARRLQFGQAYDSSYSLSLGDSDY